MQKVRIFIVYHQLDLPLYHSQVYQPILGGCAGRRPLPAGIIGDDSGEHISALNSHYAHLTAQYWIYKNYLPGAAEEYLGLHHYRRFLDAPCSGSLLLGLPQGALYPLYAPCFSTLLFPQWQEEAICAAIQDYDLVLTYPFTIKYTVMHHFNANHPAAGMIEALRVLHRIYPEYYALAGEYLNGKSTYFTSENLFIMRRELFAEYCTWCFNFLNEYSRSICLAQYNKPNDIRMPAFIMERMFNIWLRRRRQTEQLRILHVPSYILHFDPH